VYSTTAGRLNTDNIMAFNGTPTADFGVVSGTPSVSGEFGGDLLSLSSATTYYYKPFVKLDKTTNEFRDGYFAPSELKFFTTLEAAMQTITLEANGGVVSPRTISIETGKTIGDITVTPTRTGHAFTGWYPTETGGQRYPETYVITEDITLYAQWIAAAHTITLNPNGGIVSPTSIPAPAVVTLGQIFLPTPTRADHTFEGWYSEETGGTQYPETYVITSDLTLYARWTESTIYMITLNPNGGIVSPTSIPALIGETLGQISVPTPTRANHTFEGWYSAETGGSKYPETHVITDDFTMYAQWTVSAYYITLNPNGGIVSPMILTAPVGSTLGQISIPTPTRASHTFDGWYSAETGGTKYPETYTVTEDMTLHARWIAITHTITLNPGEGIVSPMSVTVEAGKTIGEIGLPFPTLDGHTFNGWFTAATGGTKYEDAFAIMGDLTLYAQWSRVSMPRTITLNPNGGEITATSVIVEEGTVLGDVALPIPVRASYDFEGWYSALTGGTLFTDSYVVTGNVTFYAQWKLMTFTDPRDGQEYWLVEVNGKTWMAENLRYIPTDASASTCYSSVNTFCEQMGRLYSGIYVKTGALVCPYGWRLPTDDEYEEFAEFATLNGAASVNMQYGGYCEDRACAGTNAKEYNETAYFWLSMDISENITPFLTPFTGNERSCANTSTTSLTASRLSCPQYNITRAEGRYNSVSLNRAGSISQETSQFEQIIRVQATGVNVTICTNRRICGSAPPPITTIPYRSIRCVQEGN
jgi:uncharacterized protein (TIGR02145 family)/uncharacterized repeat protein (TIGR02543 family)